MFNFKDFETQPLKEFTEKSYLDYSMYVILDRALPHISDGLKPVQRRIVYAMSELGLKAASKYKKSARTIGDVLGKFHPHGDSACYEAMVLMAQDFSYRYPLVDGQGNWGSTDDPKSFAAMRYTEARLTKYAETLLSELEQGTVDWVPNFDGTIKEPSTLPARLPNVLLNGTTGIAVGMATDIPPHNLREVVQACVHLLENPKASLEEICEFVKAPDFPSSAEIITPRADILAMYQTGNGTLKQRATYVQESNMVIIEALPYQVSGAKVIEQIAAQMQAKKLPMVVDLRDESDHENPVRLLIVLRSNRVDAESVMNHLFATTDLEKNYRVNLNVIGTNGKPQVKNLVQLLNEWLEFRRETVRRRLQYRLDKVLERLHILAGLLIAYLNIDEVIRIIREEDEPKAALMKKFNLTELQTEAILELKLKHLARLEEIKIRTEQDELAKEQLFLEGVLKSPSKLTRLIRDELLEDAKQFGDDRRSKIIERAPAQIINTADLQPAEPVTVILSEKGWVRAAKGHDIEGENVSYKSGDAFMTQVQGKSNQSVVFLDSTGRTYSVLPSTLPSARSQGEPLTGRLSPPPQASFIGLLTGEGKEHILMASTLGYGFVTVVEELFSKNKNGKQVLKVPDNYQALPPIPIENMETDLIVAATNTGYLLVFPVQELPVLNKGKGNKIIQIPSASLKEGKEYLKAICVVSANQKLTVETSKKSLTLSANDLKEYCSNRAKRGKLLPKNAREVVRLGVYQ